MKIKNIKLGIVGLGYVGLPLAVEFSKHFFVNGFDLSKDRVDQLKKGVDKTKEISKNILDSLDNLNYSNLESSISNCNVYIVTVPTPIDKNNVPNLKPLQNASKIIGSMLESENIVIFESTVYPGATKEICIPILEKYSGLKFNKDFYCGYSPERINPGDKKHNLASIKKIVSGSNNTVTKFIKLLYEKIIKAGVHVVSSISVAEAAKVIENTQRDVNIALINELAKIFHKLNLDTKEILEAASTKWNFLPFKPGLVGGHCIGVDPYYLTYKAQELGYHPEIILAGRRINDSMGEFIAEKTISQLTKQNINVIGAKIIILGVTFKENCPDLRNSKVENIIQSLKRYNCKVSVTDYWVDNKEIKKKLGVATQDLDKAENFDAAILAVGHKKYSKLKLTDWAKILKKNSVLIDIKSLFNKDFFSKSNIRYWRL